MTIEDRDETASGEPKTEQEGQEFVEEALKTFLGAPPEQMARQVTEAATHALASKADPLLHLGAATGRSHCAVWQDKRRQREERSQSDPFFGRRPGQLSGKRRSCQVALTQPHDPAIPFKLAHPILLSLPPNLSLPFFVPLEYPVQRLQVPAQVLGSVLELLLSRILHLPTQEWRDIGPTIE